MQHNTVEIQRPLKNISYNKAIKDKTYDTLCVKRRLWHLIYETGEDGFNLIHVKQLFRG